MNKRFLSALGLLFILTAAHVVGQQLDTGAASAQRKCATVAVTSDTAALPVRLFAPYLENRREFQAESFVLSEDAASADVVVRLSEGELGRTRIRVTSSLTREATSAVSSWTEYPGMVAMDVMTAVRKVCAPPVELVPRPASLQARTARSDAYLRGLAVCSRTVWMDLTELYDALRSRQEFAQRSIHVVPGCEDEGTTLEVTHNSSDPVEWQWKLKSAAGDVVTSGCVIASSGGDAAKKIAEEVVGEVTVRAGAQMQAAIDYGVVNPWATHVSVSGLEGHTVAFVRSNVSSSASQGATSDLAQSVHPHGFKRVMGRIGWWSGQVIADAAYVAGFVVCAIAVSEAGGPAEVCYTQP